MKTRLKRGKKRRRAGRGDALQNGGWLRTWKREGVRVLESCLVVGDGTELMGHAQGQGKRQGGSLVFALCRLASS